MRNSKSKNKKGQNSKQKHYSNYTTIQRKMLELADCFERSRIAREKAALKQPKDPKIILRHKNIKEIRLLIHAKEDFAQMTNLYALYVTRYIKMDGYIT